MYKPVDTERRKREREGERVSERESERERETFYKDKKRCEGLG